MSRLSGLQLDVLKLYRTLLKSALKKDNKHLVNFVKNEFRDKALSISKTDFKMIEHSLRYGYKQKKLIEMPGFVFAKAYSSNTTINNK